MNFLKKLFGVRKRVQCPRCLGKGFVNDADIKRLNMELFWTAGPCAYCEAKGKVAAGMIESVPVDLAYLTTEISAAERELVIANDKMVQQRVQNFNENISTLVHQIIYLHFTCSLGPEQIAEFFLVRSQLHYMNQEHTRRRKMILYDILIKL